MHLNFAQKYTNWQLYLAKNCQLGYEIYVTHIYNKRKTYLGLELTYNPYLHLFFKLTI